MLVLALAALALVGALAALAVPLALPGGGTGRGCGDGSAAVLRLLTVLAAGLALLGGGLRMCLLGGSDLGSLLGVCLLLCLRARAKRVTVALVSRPGAGRDLDRVLALGQTVTFLPYWYSARPTALCARPTPPSDANATTDAATTATSATPRRLRFPLILSCMPPTQIVVRLDRCSPQRLVHLRGI